MDATDRFWKRTLLNDRLASWILAICALVLIVTLAVVAIVSSCNHVEPQRVELTLVPADSVSGASQFSKRDDMVMISRCKLDSIVARFDAHEAQLAQKYQYVIEKREEEENYRNIFMLIFGIAVSTVGFFGYRSFADIDNRAMKIAEAKANEVAKITAKKTAEETAKTTAESYCTRNVSIFVQSYLTEHLQGAVNERIDTFVNGEGKAMIVQQVEHDLDIKLSNFLTSDEGKALIASLLPEQPGNEPASSGDESPSAPPTPSTDANSTVQF